MHAEYLLKGLQCPFCAQKIEDELQSLSWVASSTVNVVQQKLLLDMSDEEEPRFEEICQIVQRHEPEVTVIDLRAGKPVTYTLSHLTCANCAAKIKDDVSQLRSVANVELNLMQQTLSLVSTAPLSELTQEIERIVHRYEPEVRVERKENGGKGEELCEESHEGRKLILCALFFFLGLLLFYSGTVQFPYSLGYFLLCYFFVGYKVVWKALLNIRHASFFDENFLMTVSTIAAFFIGEYPEACAIMLFYQIGEYFQDRAVNESRRSITQLMDIRPDRATVLRNGEEVSVHPSEVQKGETIVVRVGERVPLDGIVLRGTSFLDTSALTGESYPREIHPEEEILSGTINVSSVLEVTVTKGFGESTATKILELVSEAQNRKSQTEHFITRFARVYTPIVMGMALLLAFIPPLILGEAWAEWIRRGCVFLIVSCPCALVVSIPLTFFGGIGIASRFGILVKGSNYLEALSRVRTVLFDKTGTLTKGMFEIVKVLPQEGVSERELLETAAYAETLSSHPIAKSLLSAITDHGIRPSEYTELRGRGIIALLNGSRVLVGNCLLLHEEGIACEAVATQGTTVYVAKDNRYLGVIVLADVVREDSKKAVEALHADGIHLAMVTGDSKNIAEAVARELGISSVHAELLPEQKMEVLEAYEARLKDTQKLAFVGDGMNDAPVLARADVGIAMGGLGSDCALEAADIVLMTDEPAKVGVVLRIARRTKALVLQNIALALGIKISFLILGALGMIGLWVAVFGDVGVTILAVFNALRILWLKEENL